MKVFSKKVGRKFDNIKNITYICRQIKLLKRVERLNGGKHSVNHRRGAMPVGRMLSSQSVAKQYAEGRS